jgi:hypothetical protein
MAALLEIENIYESYKRLHKFTESTAIGRGKTRHRLDPVEKPVKKVLGMPMRLIKRSGAPA